MVECFALDDIGRQLEEKRLSDDGKGDLTSFSNANSLSFDQLMMIGIVVSIVILSVAVVVYAARH